MKQYVDPEELRKRRLESARRRRREELTCHYENFGRTDYPKASKRGILLPKSNLER